MSASLVLPHLTIEKSIIAWRIWYAEKVLFSSYPIELDYRLCSVGKQAIWPPRKKIIAKCLALVSRQDSYVPYELSGYSHEVPDDSCSCGIYAMRTKTDLIKYLDGKHMNLADSNTGVIKVIGRVSLYGETIEHENGYRAQYAYPYALMVLFGDQRIVSSLREQYQVDVRAVITTSL